VAVAEHAGDDAFVSERLVLALRGDDSERGAQTALDRLADAGPLPPPPAAEGHDQVRRGRRAGGRVGVDVGELSQRSGLERGVERRLQAEAGGVKLLELKSGHKHSPTASKGRVLRIGAEKIVAKGWREGHGDRATKTSRPGGS
jgi:hypothetical protein